MAAKPTFVLDGKHLKKGETLPETSPGKLRIFSMKYCPFAQRARLVAAHKNIPHEIVNVALTSKPDWFLEKNPKGTTPTIEIDGKILYDSIVSCDFLDEMSSENQLHPKDPYQRAQERLRVEKYGSKLFAYYPLLFDRSEETVQAKKEMVKEGFEELNTDLKGTYLGGDAPSMLDFMVYPVMEKVVAASAGILDILRDITDLQKYPKVAKWFQAMQETAANQATAVPIEKVTKFLEGYAQHKPDYDL